MLKKMDDDAVVPTTEVGSVEAGLSAVKIAPQQNSLLRALDLFNPEQFEQIVENILKTRRSGAVKSARQSLDAQIDACEYIKIKGVRPGKASKAPFAQLKLPIIEECVQYENDRLMGALLRVWQEGNTALRKTVKEYLDEAEIALNQVDFREAIYHGLWRPEDWEKHSRALLEKTADPKSDGEDISDLDAAETRLMLSLVSGALPALPVEISAGQFEDFLLSEFLVQLWKYSPSAPIWEEIDNFIEELGVLRDLKGQEMIDLQIKARQEQIAELDERFKEHLTFLQCDLDRIQTLAEQNAELPALAGTDFLADLVELLYRYDKVYRPATRREREETAEDRSRIEDGIIELVREWENEIEKCQEELQEDLKEKENESADSTEIMPSADSSDSDDVSAEEQINTLRAQLDTERAKRKDANARLKEQQAESRKRLRFFRNEESKNKRLGKEIDELRELVSQQTKVEVLRNTQRDYLVGYPPDWIKDVKDAINQAKRTYSEELIFALNSKSEQNNAFDDPDEVFKALGWLAREFRKGKLNPDTGSNLSETLDRSLQENVRPSWSYTPNQSAITVGKNPDWYKTEYEGEELDVHEHIGRGKSYKAKGNIRIGFTWNESRQKVIVGYIGRHQKTGQS